MNRRDFITLLGGAVLAQPLPARAQQPRKIPQLGVLNVTHTQSEDGLRRGLQQLGYVEGQNIAVVSRQALLTTCPTRSKPLSTLRQDKALNFWSCLSIQFP